MAQPTIAQSLQKEYLSLGIKKASLQCCEQLEGMLIEREPNRWIIVSTRGIVTHYREEIEEVIREIQTETGCRTHVGIGYANTATLAEHCAQLALQEIKKEGTSILMVRDDMLEQEKQKTDSNIQYTVNDAELVRRLENTTISSKIFYRIQTIAHYLNWDVFSTKDISAELNMTERNAQRIVSELVKVELIEQVGEEKKPGRGRSTKIYKFVE